MQAGRCPHLEPTLHLNVDHAFSWSGKPQVTSAHQSDGSAKDCVPRRAHGEVTPSKSWESRDSRLTAAAEQQTRAG